MSSKLLISINLFVCYVCLVFIALNNLLVISEHFVDVMYTYSRIYSVTASQVQT